MNINIPHILQVPPWEDKDYGIRKPKQLDAFAIEDFPDLILKSDNTVIPKQYAKNLLGILFKSDIKKNSLSIVKSDFTEMTNAITSDSLHAFGNALYKKNGLHGLRYAWICQLTQSHIDEIRAFIDVNKFAGGDTLACRDLLRVLAISFEFTQSMPALRELLFQHTKGKKRFRTLTRDLVNHVRSCVDYVSTAVLIDYATPDFGFDQHGCLTLDFDDEILVRLDNQWTATLYKENKIIRSLPRISKKLDETRQQQQQAIKEDYKAKIKAVNKLYKQKVKQLQQEMTKPAFKKQDIFQTIFLDHSLLKLLAQGVVWGAYDGGYLSSTLLHAFMIADDGTWLDSDYHEIDKKSLPENCHICVLHPVHISAEQQEKFQQMLMDFQVMQPFEQMFLQVFRLSDEEKKQQCIQRFHGHAFSGAYLYEHYLMSTQWERASDQWDRFEYDQMYVYFKNDYSMRTYIRVYLTQIVTSIKEVAIIDSIKIENDDPIAINQAMKQLLESMQAVS